MSSLFFISNTSRRSISLVSKDKPSHNLPPDKKLSTKTKYGKVGSNRNALDLLKSQPLLKTDSANHSTTKNLLSLGDFSINLECVLDLCQVFGHFSSPQNEELSQMVLGGKILNSSKKIRLLYENDVDILVQSTHCSSLSHLESMNLDQYLPMKQTLLYPEIEVNYDFTSNNETVCFETKTQELPSVDIDFISKQSKTKSDLNVDFDDSIISEEVISPQRIKGKLGTPKIDCVSDTIPNSKDLHLPDLIAKTSTSNNPLPCKYVQDKKEMISDSYRTEDNSIKLKFFTNLISKSNPMLHSMNKKQHRSIFEFFRSRFINIKQKREQSLRLISLPAQVIQSYQITNLPKCYLVNLTPMNRAVDFSSDMKENYLNTLIESSNTVKPKLSQFKCDENQSYLNNITDYFWDDKLCLTQSNQRKVDKQLEQNLLNTQNELKLMPYHQQINDKVSQINHQRISHLQFNRRMNTEHQLNMNTFDINHLYTKNSLQGPYNEKIELSNHYANQASLKKYCEDLTHFNGVNKQERFLIKEDLSTICKTEDYDLHSKSIQILKHQPHQKQKLFRNLQKLRLTLNNSLLGGGAGCSSCSSSDPVVDGLSQKDTKMQNEQNNLIDEMKNQKKDIIGDEELEKLKEIREADYKDEENLATHDKLEKRYKKHSEQKYIDNIINSGKQYQTVLEELSETFFKFRETFIYYDRVKCINLSNIMINYLYHKLNQNDDTSRQKDITQLTMKLEDIKDYIEGLQKRYPCLDLLLIFDLLISLNKSREGRDEGEKSKVIKLYEFSMDVIKVATSIEKAIDVISNIDKLPKILENAQDQMSKLFEDSKEFNEGASIAMSWFGMYQSTKLFNCLNILWITKIQRFQSYYTDKSQQDKQIPVDEEIEFYIQMFSEIRLENSNDVINYILLQIKQLIDKNKANLSQVAQNNKEKKSIKEIISFAKMLSINGEVDNKFNDVFKLVADLFIKPTQRYLFIQILIKIIEIENLFSVEEKKQMLTNLCLKFIQEKEESVKIIFMHSKQIILFVQELQRDKEKQNQLLEQNEIQSKLLSSILGVKAVSKFKQIHQQITSKDLDKIIIESLIQTWEAGVRSRQHQNIIQHKDDILLDVMQLYVEQSISFLNGNEEFQKSMNQEISKQNHSESLKQNIDQSQNSNQIQSNLKKEKSALNLIVKHFLMKNFCYSNTSNQIQENINQNKCLILSILADGGTGKSMFLKKLETVLINKEEYKEENVNYIPLMIKCNSLDPINPSIEDFLLSQKITLNQIENLKKSERNKLILLDGYDEYTGEYFKVFDKLKINQWKNTLVVVTSRLEKISVKDAEIYFNYYDSQGNKGDSSNYTIVQLNKFEKEDINSYFDNFKKEQITKDSSSFNKENYDEMKDYCLKNNQLINLMKLPINLYLITRMITNLDEQEKQIFIKILKNASDQIEIQEFFFQKQFDKKAIEFIQQNKQDLVSTQNIEKIKQYVSNSHFEYFQTIAMKMFINKGKLTNFLQVDKSQIEFQCQPFNLLSKRLLEKLLLFIKSFVDQKVITRVKLSTDLDHNNENTQEIKENSEQKINQEDIIIEFRHKSIFEYFAARAMKYDFDIHKENIYELSLDQLKQFNINQKVIMNPGENQSEQQILLKLYKLIKLDRINCDYQLNYTENDIQSNNRYIQYIKKAKINSTLEKSEIDQGSSNLISALFISKFSFEYLHLKQCSLSQAYLTNKKYTKIRFDQCNLSNSNLNNVDLTNFDTSNTSHASINGLQKVFDTNNIYSFNKVIYYNQQLLTISESGYLNAFQVSQTSVKLLQSKKISNSPLSSLQIDMRNNTILISAGVSLFKIESKTFEINNIYSFQYPISCISISQSNKSYFVTLTNSTTYYGNFDQGFQQINVQGNISSLSSSNDILAMVDGTDLCIYEIKQLTNNTLQVIPINTIEGHTDTIRSIAFSPDGKYLATGSEDNICKIWNTEEGFELINTIEGHTEAILSVAFSPDGKYLAIGSSDKTCKIWNTEKGFELINTISGHISSIWSVAFSPDGKYLATGSEDNTCKIWDTEKGFELINTIEGHTKPIWSVAFSPEGKYVATSSDDKTCKIWNAEKGFELISTIEGHTSSISSVAFSPDGKYLATGSEDKTCRIWNIEKGFELIKTIEGHTDAIRSVAFSPDGKQVATGSFDKTCKIWNTEKGFELINTIEGHTYAILSVAFSLEGKYLATGSSDKTCKIWNTEKGFELINTTEGHTSLVWSVAFSPDGKYIATGSVDKTFKIWNTEKGFELINTIEGHTDAILSVAFSPDGKYVATGSYDNTCKIWNTENGFELINTIEGHTSSILSVAFSPDGKYLATGSYDNTCKIWNTEKSFELINTIERHTDAIRSVAFSPDGKYLAACYEDNTFKIWNTVKDFELINTIEGHSHAIFSVAFSPDGKYLATCSQDKTCKIWNTEKGFELINTIEGHTQSIMSVAFSPDGKYLASGSDDNTCKIWNTEKGFELINTIEEHTSCIWSVAFSLDGKYLATGSEDNTCKIWNTEKGFELINTIQGHTDVIRSVAFSPDVKYLATCAEDKTCKIWNTEKGFDLINTIQGHTDVIRSVAFSLDEKYLAIGFRDNTCKLWAIENNKIEYVGDLSNKE